ncbi:MAG TPA: glycosyl hydrolase family 28-related protein [Propionicimonas sp.]|jgi:hypothetical protein
MYFTTHETVTRDKMNSISGRLSVVGFGALGDGVTDDTAEIQACLAAAVTYGLTAYVPASTGPYMIDASVGIQMGTAGMRLELHPAAVLKAITNNLTTYAIVNVTAADCSVTGGAVQGDVQTHTGSTGEWGHCVQVNAGGHRFRAEGVVAKHAWGDGFNVTGGPTDVTLLSCTADANRRQGASIIGGTRTRIIGGSYINTGTITATAPSAGIDVEPNPSSGIDVKDCIIEGAVCSGNVGPGLQLVRATAQTTTATVSSTRCISNGSHGILIAGSAGTLIGELNGVTCSGSTNAGIFVGAPGVTINGAHIVNNTEQGVSATAKVVINGGNVENNGKPGFNFSTGSDGTTVTGTRLSGNCTAAATTYYEVDIFGVGCILTGVISTPATSGNRAIYAFNVRSAATGTQLIGCRGSAGTSGVILVAPTDTIQIPAVGATVTTLNAASTDLATVIALTNQIRTLLINNAGLAK